MRKVIFILVALLATALQGRAQTQAITAGEDSTINVVAWFNKNDTTEYVYTKSNVLVSDGDTTRTGNTEEMFRLVVADSTSDGYRLKFEPISWKSDNSKDSIKSSLMWAAKSQAPVVFDTNEYGKIERLEKWRDVRDKAIPAITGYFEKLYAKNPAIDSIMPKKNYLSLLRLGFNNEDAIREMYSEVIGLFSCHGKAFNIGMTNDEDSTTGYPTHLTTIVSYEDVDTTDAESYLGDYFIRNSSIVTIPSDEAKALTNSLLGTIFSKDFSDKTESFINDSIDMPMEIRLLTDYHFFYSGWPKLVRKQTIVKVGEIWTNVATETIEWNRYRWNEPDDDQPDGGGQTDL